MIISMGIARKFNEEIDFVSLRNFSIVAGVKEQEYIALELYFCCLLDWEMYCGVDDLNIFISSYL